MDFYIRMLKQNSQFVYNEKPLISTVDAPLRVTHDCLSDQRILIDEMLVVLNKITKNNLRDIKFLRFLTSRFTSNRITSLTELNNFSENKRSMPFIIYPALFFSKIYINIFGKKTVSE